MDVLDYGLSFIGSEGPANAARFWVESRTCIIDDRAGTEEQYVQCGACKSEHTFAQRELFCEDNYDFIPVFGPNCTVVFRQRSSWSESYRQVRPRIEAWGRPIYRLKNAVRPRLLRCNAEIREATHAGLPLVAQCEWSDPHGRRRAIVELPIKTMNINDERDIYQVDTGPAVWPDLALRDTPTPEILWPAFAAFNTPGFADFVIVAPTPIRQDGREVARVHHYSRRETVRGENRLYALGA